MWHCSRYPEQRKPVLGLARYGFFSFMSGVLWVRRPCCEGLPNALHPQSVMYEAGPSSLRCPCVSMHMRCQTWP
jgi:hypothetical protein